MVFHPRDPAYRRPLTRRDFLRRSLATGVALPSAAAILAACGEGNGDGGTGTTGGDDTAPRFGTPENPATLQSFPDNPPIESGLEPEDGPLVIYNWEQYFYKAVLKDFGKKFGVDWKYETFFNMEEAIQKFQTGQVTADVFFPTIDYVPKLAAAKLLQPLNHDYLPNTTNLWPALKDPFYDKGSQYSLPYTIYHTGIAWRTDMVPIEPDALVAAGNPYDILWNTEHAGITGIYDDYREAMALAMLRNEGAGVDVNTKDPAIIDRAKQALIDLNSTMDIRLTIDGAYAGIPEGKFGLHQSWSGDIQAGPFYAGDPKTEAGLFRYLWPARDGLGGTVGNDTYSIPTTAKNPVLAHMFLNYMMEEFNGIKNWTWVGYQVPFTVVDTETIFEESYPGLEGWFSWDWKGHWENLKPTIVTEEDFDIGKRAIGLPVEVDLLYQNAFQEFRSGATVEES